MLNGTSLVPDFPLDRLAFRTEGLSGSDLKEVCRNAAMMPVREYMKKADGDRELLEKDREEVSTILPLNMPNFSRPLHFVSSTK